jgi:hypothetical protein
MLRGQQCNIPLWESIEGSWPVSVSGVGQIPGRVKGNWFPLYAYARRRGNNPDEAADLTQDFLCRLLNRRFLDNIDPAKERFRSFLLVAMKRHMANAWERQTAQKCGGDQTVLSFTPMLCR